MNKIPLYIVTDGDICSTNCPFLISEQCTLFNEYLETHDDDNGSWQSRCHACKMVECFSEDD